MPLFSGGLSTLWALGFAGFLGFTIDLLMIIVFLLITARALSHSVQSMERYHEEYFRLANGFFYHGGGAATTGARSAVSRPRMFSRLRLMASAIASGFRFPAGCVAVYD